MRINSILTFVISILLLTNCSKDETPGPESEKEEDVVNYFTVKISADKDTELSTDYLIIHDANGELVEYKSFEKGETIVFSADRDSITDFFTVTHFSTKSGENPTLYYLYSYSDIKVGSSWTISKNFINSGVSNVFPSTGNFSIQISGEGEKPSEFQISNGSKSNVLTFPNYASSQDQNWGSFVNVDMEAGFDDFMITGLISTGNPKYYLLENVEDNAYYQISYDNFLNFDSYFDFSSPSDGYTTMMLVGYKNDQPPLGPGFELYHYHPNNSYSIDTESLKIGYLDNYFTGYAFYATYTNGFVYSRNYFGATPPSSYRVPELPSVFVENPSITNFKVSMELDYVRSESVWNYRVQLPEGGWTETNWYVSASKDSYPIMGEIPTELYEKYPNMKVDEITYSRTKFYLDSYTHPEFIAKTFVTQDIETTPRNEEFIIIGPEK